MHTVDDVLRAVFQFIGSLSVARARLPLSSPLAFLVVFLAALAVFVRSSRSSRRLELLAEKGLTLQSHSTRFDKVVRVPALPQPLAFLYNMLEVASTFVPRTLALPVALPFLGEASTTPSEFSNSAFAVEALDRMATQPYDAFLVLDVEATCQEGTDLNWPNEIIEWPVCLLRWRQKDSDGRVKELYTADEFRSFVKPTWRPKLSEFCTALTGITQADVNKAPKFARVLESFRVFLIRNGLIDDDGQRLVRFVWCTDGPFDIRDFVVKQCFISRIVIPQWLMGDVLDVRKAVNGFLNMQEAASRGPPAKHPNQSLFPKRRSLNIPKQLLALSLPAFVGRQHSGIDDTRNVARILTELARRGVRLEPNTIIYPGRRWRWMGRPGQILENYC